MATASAGSIFVDLLLRQTKYDEGLRKASSSTKTVTTDIGNQFAKLEKRLLAFATITTFTVLTRNAINTASSIKDLADQLSLGTEELQKYQVAAQLSGVSSETLQTALIKLNSQIAAGEIGYKNIGDALTDISDKLKNATTGAERAGIVNEAFGAKLGAKLIPFLKDGSEGIARLIAEAEKLGVILSDETIQQTEAFGDQLDLLGLVISRNFQQGFLSQFIDETGTLQDIFTDKEFQEGIREIGENFGYVVKQLAELLKLISDNKEEFKVFAQIAAGAYGGGRLGGGFGAAIGGAGGFLYAAAGGKEKNADPKELNDQLAKLRAGVARMEGKDLDAVNEKRQIGLNLTNEQIKASQKQSSEIEALYQRNVEYFDGLTNEQRDFQKSMEEFDKLLAQGRITEYEYLTAIGQRYDETIGKTEKWGFDLEAITKRAAENAQDALADFLFDPFQDGLDGMLKGFIDTLRKMAAEAAAAHFFKGVGDSKGGGAGGLLDGVFGKVGGFLENTFSGWFAEGGYIEPGKWGIAGEEGAEMIYGGRTGATVYPSGSGSGGNTYNIDARGADMAAVRRLEQSIIALAGPGVIESRVTNAQTRGAL